MMCNNKFPPLLEENLDLRSPLCVSSFDINVLLRLGFVFQTIRVLFLWFIFLHIFQSNTKGYIDTKRNKKYLSLSLLISPSYMYMYYSFISLYSSCLVTQYCYYYKLYKKYMLKQPLNL